MNYIIKEYEIPTNKILESKKIVTLSDLHFNQEITYQELDSLLVKIVDLAPNYIFILGDLFTFQETENSIFKMLIINFLNELASMAKTFVIFGNKDIIYSNQFKSFEVNPLAIYDFYDEANVRLLNNEIHQELDLNIVNFQKSYNAYLEEFKKINTLKKEIEDFFLQVDGLLNDNKYSILLTHSHLDLLKTKCEQLKQMDLILAGHTHNALVPNFLENIFPKNRGLITANHFFPKFTRGDISNKGQSIIINGGITKISDAHSPLIKTLTKKWYPGEIDLITLKKMN